MAMKPVVPKLDMRRTGGNPVSPQLPRRDSNEIDSINENAGHLEHSENGGTPGGTLQVDDDSAAGLKARALDDLQRAWKSIRRMESLSEDQAEVKAAERALSLVDKAFAELERKAK